MGDLTDAEIEAAFVQGAKVRAKEPRAMAAHYDREGNRIVVALTNGCTFMFPPQLAEGLSTATADQIADVEVLGAGGGLHWGSLDLDFSVPGLLAGLFGTRAFMATQAGQSRSQAKAAARANGVKGGRPPRSAKG